MHAREKTVKPDPSRVSAGKTRKLGIPMLMTRGPSHLYVSPRMSSVQLQEQDHINDVMSSDDDDVEMVDSVNVSADVGCACAPKPVSTEKKSRLRSDVWDFCNLVKNKDGKKYGVCKACNASYKYDSQKGGTSSMRRHVCPERQSKDIGQMILSAKNGQLSSRVRKVDQMKFRDLVSALLIARNVQFSLVEWKEFRDICAYLSVDDAKPISRNTGKADVVKKHKTRKEGIRNILKLAPGRMCLTSDMWTSVTPTGYITLTVHFLDQNWEFKKYLLNFCELPPPHTGENLSAKLFAMIEDWGIEDKVSNITLDNAANNGACAKIMQSRLVAKKILFNKGQYFHVRCCAHILSLIVKDGLVKIDPFVLKIRKSVKSQVRKQKFLDIVDALGMSGIGRGIRQDVKTRWNSTYLMLDSCLAYRAVFSHLKEVDSNYKHCPTDEEWEQIEVVTKFLKTFYDLTTLFSGNPRCKLQYLIFAYSKLYPDVRELESKVEAVRENMKKLYNEYYTFSRASGTGTQNVVIQTGGILPIKEEYAAAQENGGDLQSDLSELDLYLSEKHGCQRNVPFDILMYWKGTEQRFPVLSRMAGDILSIHISTVASESAFSISGRVINRFRSSLLLENAEAVITTRDWDHGVGKEDWDEDNVIIGEDVLGFELGAVEDGAVEDGERLLLGCREGALDGLNMTGNRPDIGGNSVKLVSGELTQSLS
ncbi:hypothetical protein C5167_001066 [Papaver somniferum]|uniref:BED-type domain-containing protein n=1 Tax=Papaver somniferum TaxID=3469 RepID=A0A4Y7KUD3_PAPSO|nr:hypothetical protein C5167_001066 [Papaver somniferum]